MFVSDRVWAIRVLIPMTTELDCFATTISTWMQSHSEQQKCIPDEDRKGQLEDSPNKMVDHNILADRSVSHRFTQVVGTDARMDLK